MVEIIDYTSEPYCYFYFFHQDGDEAVVTLKSTEDDDRSTEMDGDSDSSFR